MQNNDVTTAVRLGVFAKLAKSAPGPFGRTALMKLCYFLQVLKDVPLGYDFSLYSYGPFDSEVLSDLQTAESLSVLDSSVSYYSGGYSYQITTSENSNEAIANGGQFIDKYEGRIEWVAKTFAGRSASELELLSTIVYVNRTEGLTDDTSLIQSVKRIKPHFSEPEIQKKVTWLKKDSLLGS